MTPIATRVSDIKAVAPSNFPPVEPLESEAQQSCPIPNVETQLIGDVESTSGSTKPPENRLIAVEISVLESFQKQRRSNSMTDMAFTTTSVVDASETMQSVLSTEMNVLTESPFDESTDSRVMTPAATGVSDIETLVSSTLPPVQPLEFDEKSCLIPNVET